MRRLFTNDQARVAGITKSALRWGVKKGRWIPAAYGGYAEGSQPLSNVDRARAKVLASGAVAERNSRACCRTSTASSWERRRRACRRCSLPDPLRQFRVENRHSDFVAYVDLTTRALADLYAQALARPVAIR
jgi:hypothetical protein